MSDLHLDGDLRSTALPKILLVVSAHRGSGILTVQGDDDIVAVSFVDGAMVTADALNQTVEDGIGRVLQKQGLLTSADFESAVRDYQGGAAGTFGDFLVGRGLIDRGAFLEALRIQTVRLMLQILAWRQGEYKFYSGDEVSYEDGFMPISVSELLVHAVDRLGEKIGLLGSLPDIDRVYRRVPPRGRVQILSEDGDGGVGIWITPDQNRLLQRLDGRHSAADAGRDLRLDPHTIRFGLYHLLQYDLAEPVGKAPAAIGLGDTTFAPLSGTVPTVGGAADAAAARTGAEALEPVDLAPLDDARSLDARSLDARSLDAEALGLDDTASRLEAERLKAEIFTPPSPDEIEARRDEQVRESRAPAYAGVLLRWIGPVLALGLVAALVASLVVRPVGVLLPFPWQDNHRSTLERQIRQSTFQRLDRAARTYFLTEKIYPDRLEDLDEVSLLSSSELRDPAGYQLDYATDGLSYLVRMRDGNQQIEGLGAAEAITGDFLIDPQFLRSAASAEAPLVLLD